MRRLRDLIQLQTSDMGGDESVSEAEKVLVRRCSMLTLQLEMLEQRFAANDGEATVIQLELYQRASGSLRRCPVEGPWPRMPAVPAQRRREP